MNFTKAVAVPNKQAGDYYSGKLQLIVPYPHGVVTGDWVDVHGSVYSGVMRVTDYFDNPTAKIAALYFGDVYFAGNDMGTLEKLNYNPIAAKVVEAPAVSSPGLLSEQEFKNLVWDRMGQIENNNPVLKKQIIDSYKSTRFGYTQTLAHNAIKMLKEEGTIPMNLWGVGIWGQGDWVIANYPKDDYVFYGTAAPTTLQPGYYASTVEPVRATPVIAPVNPNPAILSTSVVNPYAPVSAETTKSATITSTMTESDYKALIGPRMDIIKADKAFIKQIQDTYKNTRFGYTQTIATNAIKELKEAGKIPLNQWGSGIWGQGDWVISNYPKDVYVEPATSTQPPVIPVVDPNPGSTITHPVLNLAGSTTAPSGGSASAGTIAVEKNTIVPEKEQSFISNPIVKYALIGLGIILLIKILKNK